MITPIKFSGNYVKKEDVIDVPSWVNEPYKRKRQENKTKVHNRTMSDVYIARGKAHNKTKHKHFSIEQLAAIGAATLAMAGIAKATPLIIQTGAKEGKPSTSTVEETPTVSIEEPVEIIEEPIEIIEEIPIETMEYKYNIPDFEINLSDEQAMSLENFIENWQENKKIYEQVASKTNVPAELIAAIHWRESGGNFDAYLHNGTKIGETLDTINGSKIFYSWQDSALDALTNYGGNPDNIIQDDFQSYCDYAEHYNGMGYSKYHNMNSPYVWAGTNLYSSGKYVQDGNFDPNKVDRQLGVAVMLKTLLELEEE